MPRLVFALALGVSLWPAVATADPLTAAIAASAAAAGVSTGTFLAIQAAKIIVGFAFTAASTALTTPNVSQPRVRQKAGEVSSVVPKRAVYGRVRTLGAPVAYYVKGATAYIGYIFNSRPSSGNFSVSLDKRPVTLSGDVHDFATGGLATNGIFAGGAVRVWIGRGDQVGPPAMFLSEAPEYFRSTDAWHGLTVAWLRCGSGGAKTQAKRWPRWLPEFEIEGDWSLLWDPSEPGQDPDDPETWGFSRNRTLAVLDFLMRNPVAPYKAENLDVASFVVSAAADAEPVGLKAGGTESRWTADGVVMFDGIEIEEGAEALHAAGCGRVVRVGGRLGVTPGKWVPPAATLDEVILDDGFEFSDLGPGADVPLAVEGTYTRPDADWQLAPVGRREVPGANGASREIVSVEMPFVTSGTQAQRLLEHIARRAGAQKRVTATFLPEAFDSVTGDAVTLATPVAAINGAYEVETSAPDLFPAPGDAVAMRVSMTMSETAAAHFAWDPEVDEVEIGAAPEHDGFIADLAPGGALSAVSGAAAGGSRSRIRFTFDPSPSARVADYEWQWRLSGGSYQAGGLIDADLRDGSGDVFGVLSGVTAGESHDIRVRAIDADDDVSVWVGVSGVVALPPDVTVAVPTNMTATGAAGKFILSAKTPNASGVTGLEFHIASSNSTGAATLVIRQPAPPNATVGYEHTGFAAGVTRYFWAKTVGVDAATSAFSTGASATTS